MSYLGRGVDKISNIEKLDNITFDGSSSYTLQKGSVNFVPSSAQAILISIDGVVQSGNFTVSASTIDFGTAIAGTSTCNFIIHLGTGLLTTPSDGSVSAAKLASSSVTRDKLNLISDASNPSLIAKGTSGVSEGYIQLNCAENSHGIKLKSPPHSAGQSYTLTFPQSISADTFLKTDGSGNLSFAAAGGITMADNFRLSAGFTGDAAPIDANLERNDTAPSLVTLGSQMSESSGTFTFPSTGIYYISFTVSSKINGDSRFTSAQIRATTNNSSYSVLTEGSAHITGNSGGTTYTIAQVDQLVDITDTSNQKVRFHVNHDSTGTTTMGNTSYDLTAMRFIRLADT